MDKIEKIKEWVKKQKKEELARNSIGVITGKALFVDANELLSFLDTLSEEPDKSLEEEISRTYHDGSVTDTEDIDHVAYENIARYFAQWQKSQMLKDAVEGQVCATTSARWIEAEVSREDGFICGQKVRIVVLKEEEESK